jgi:hypothetical protein
VTPLIFWYSPDQEDDHVAATPEEIDAALDHVASLVTTNMGAVAEITRQDVETDGLYAGLNGDVGTLHYVANGTAFYSQGNRIAETDSLSYDYQWNVMMFPPDSEIPIADVRSAVQEYFRTGTRPSGVTWQEWAPVRDSDGVPRIAHDDPA